MEYTHNKKKQKNSHQNYWRSFSLLQKELAKKHNNGRHISFFGITDHATMSIILRVMGRQGTKHGGSSAANNPIDSRDKQQSFGSKDMLIKDRYKDRDESLSSPKPMKA
ncbi:uncharacterized protein DS421_19g667930 [Arachis hypogaea]|uniref:Uncharacterized protein n=1 Tax=Arachis hypogaea TaxID=3818 RepID=A0A6B9VDG3_ARAHY|nr:uncharacterized protein DS421_19g667930 [Arachis hypogaea]